MALSLADSPAPTPPSDLPPIFHLENAMSRRLPAALLAISLLSACGVADVGSSAATAAKLKAQEAEQARATKAQVEKQLEAARQQEEQQRKAIDAATR